MQLTIDNFPDFTNESDKSIFNSRVVNAINDILLEKYKIKTPKTTLDFVEKKQSVKPSESDEKAEDVAPISLKDPQFTIDQLVLDDKVMEELQYIIKFEAVKDKVYTEWGLSKFEKSPKQALNFWGDSGTGKTMAAEALANVMGKKIIPASYADIESKYHGDGPKNARRLFEYAAKNDAVLFIDEADSLLSQRINATQGSEQAANSLRSELLIQIEKFPGIVIFATNLASNYDSAFVTRIKSIHFEKPDQALRQKLWEKMLFDKDVHLPFANPIDVEKLSKIDNICGRDIKNAIIKAAVKTAIDGTDFITQQILEDVVNALVESNQKVAGKLSNTEKKEIGKKIQRQMKKDKIQRKRGYF
jgi:AAA+ superfamily predicted ATPase